MLRQHQIQGHFKKFLVLLVVGQRDVIIQALFFNIVSMNFNALSTLMFLNLLMSSMIALANSLDPDEAQ